ncbi:MAG: ATP-grasp domain-containing protein [candidate division NC10 bacterium]|nr:ATP-grasp domain-containing protein [candidate division NC10 bacterium]
MPRVLLLLPTTTYRSGAFLEAAKGLGVEVVVASERPNVFQEAQPGRYLSLDFFNPDKAARQAIDFAATRPIDAIVGIDDATTVLAAALSAALSLPHNSVASTAASRDKHQMRDLLSRDGVPVPSYVLRSLDDDPVREARRMVYPCVVKPLMLSASRGVIRADDEGQFVGAVRRLEAILCTPDAAALGDIARQVLIEAFVPGREVALEGLLVRGELHVLALFDKPDPLDGPFFEETIYVTPSRLPAAVQAEIASCAARAARALGLQDGPVHAELRVGSRGPSVIEVAARSIGGLCSRTLRFGTGLSLEELILRHALGIGIPSLERERRAAGVMMIPIPRAGVLKEVRGQAESRSVSGIEEIAITAHPGEDLVPLPEGARYLGFIFARAESPERVEAALREAHRRLEFIVMPPREARGTG